MVGSLPEDRGGRAVRGTGGGVPGGASPLSDKTEGAAGDVGLRKLLTLALLLVLVTDCDRAKSELTGSGPGLVKPFEAGER